MIRNIRNTQYAIRNEPHSQLHVTSQYAMSLTASSIYALCNAPQNVQYAIRSTPPCSQPVVYYAIRNTQYATMLTANHVIRRAFVPQNTQEADNTQRKPYCHECTRHGAKQVKSTLTAPGRKTVDARAGGRWAVPQTQHNAQATLYEHNSIISMCNKPVVRTKREKRLYFTVQTRVNSTIYRQIGSRTHKPPNFPAACKGGAWEDGHNLLQPGHAPMLAPAALAASLRSAGAAAARPSLPSSRFPRRAPQSTRSCWTPLWRLRLGGRLAQLGASRPPSDAW